MIHLSYRSWFSFRDRPAADEPGAARKGIVEVGAEAVFLWRPRTASTRRGGRPSWRGRRPLACRGHFREAPGHRRCRRPLLLVRRARSQLAQGDVFGCAGRHHDGSPILGGVGERHLEGHLRPCEKPNATSWPGAGVSLSCTMRATITRHPAEKTSPLRFERGLPLDTPFDPIGQHDVCPTPPVSPVPMGVSP